MRLLPALRLQLCVRACARARVCGAFFRLRKAPRLVYKDCSFVLPELHVPLNYRCFNTAEQKAGQEIQNILFQSVFLALVPRSLPAFTPFVMRASDERFNIDALPCSDAESRPDTDMCAAPRPTIQSFTPCAVGDLDDDYESDEELFTMSDNVCPMCCCTKS